MRPAPACLSTFLTGLEARRNKAYRDGTGRLTIGVGHTGLDVQPDTVWTDAQIDAQLDRDCTRARAELATRVSDAAIAKLSDHQYAAILSFVFNLGTGRTDKPTWTIWKLLDAGNLADVPGQMMLFVNERDPHTGELVRVEGLINRRAAEVHLWDTADVETSVAIAAAAPPSTASGVLRDADTPPTPPVVKPLAQSKTFISTVTGACLSCAAVVAPYAQSVTETLTGTADKIAPIADASSQVGHIRNAILIGAAVASIAASVLFALKQHKAANP
jgi:lysozyme